VKFSWADTSEKAEGTHTNLNHPKKRYQFSLKMLYSPLFFSCVTMNGLSYFCRTGLNSSVQSKKEVLMDIAFRIMALGVALIGISIILFMLLWCSQDIVSSFVIMGFCLWGLGLTILILVSVNGFSPNENKDS
jgi:hypothetical protein